MAVEDPVLHARPSRRQRQAGTIIRVPGHPIGAKAPSVHSIIMMPSCTSGEEPRPADHFILQAPKVPEPA